MLLVFMVKRKETTSVKITKDTLQLLYKCRDLIAKKHNVVTSLGGTVRYLALWYIKLQEEERRKEKMKKELEKKEVEAGSEQS